MIRNSPKRLKYSLWKSLLEFEKGEADFADYIIGSTNKAIGCQYTVTLDKKAALSTNYRLLE